MAFQETQWLYEYLDTFPTTSSVLDEDDKNSIHPLHSIIHRKAQHYQGSYEIPDKKDLGRAKRNPREYNKVGTKGTLDWKVNMDGLHIGMSCNSCCDVQNFCKKLSVFPYNLLERNLPEGTISNLGDVVIFQGIQLPVIRCFNREIVSSQTQITVRDALNQHGKNDDLLLEHGGEQESFSCYWDTKQHATICLRKEIVVSARSFESDGSLIFGNELFNRDVWNLCDDYFAVKIPKKLLEIASGGDDFNDAISLFDSNTQCIFLALIQAFFVACIDDVNENVMIDDSISTLYIAKTLDKLTFQQKSDICDIIDKYEYEIFGWDSTEWLTIQRPAIVKQV